MKTIFTIIVAVFVLTANAQNFDWTEQNSGVTEHLRDVYFASSLNGWAVGDDGIILYTDDGGTSWTIQTSGVTERFRAVFALDLNNAFVVGGENSKIMLKTIDAGLTWQSLDKNNKISQIQILDVHFTTEANGWVITTDSIYYTSDGGESWVNEMYVDGISQVNHRALTATSDSTAFVASRRKRSGTLNPFADVFYRLADYVFPWVQSSSPAFSSSDFGLYAIEFANFNNGFAGGANGILYKAEELTSEDLSGPWVVNLDLSSTTPSIINSISFPTALDGMFSIGTTVDATNYTLVYHTSDQGTTWSAQPDSISDLLSGITHSPNATSAWAVGAFGKIFKGVPSSTAINQLRLNLEISIYPNPATNMVNVEINTKNNELTSYSLADMSGRIIKKGQWGTISSNSKCTIDVSDITKGVYLLTISTTDGQGAFRVLKK